MLNPYQSPDTTSDTSPPIARKDAAFIWFAATVVGLTCVWMLVWYVYWNQDMIGQLLAFDFLFESIRDAGPIAIVAIVLYAAMRHVFRFRFDYASTRLSLVVAGVLVFACVAMFDFWERQRWFGDQLWLVAAVASVPLGWGVAALEGKIAGSSTDVIGDTIPIRQQAGHASVLWFAATIFAINFILSALLDAGRTPRGAAIIQQLRELSEMSAVASIILTAAYGLLSVCIIRRYPATSVSRVTAAVIYVGILWALSFAWLSPPPWSIPLFFCAPALVAVPADRLVARYTADV